MSSKFREVSKADKTLPEGHSLIYGLLDPRTRKLRYVGQTKQPARRLWLHCSASNNKHNRPVCNWVRSLLHEELRPVMVELEITQEADASEVGWIDHCRKKKIKLLNANKGGLTLDHVHKTNGTLLEYRQTPLHRKLLDLKLWWKTLTPEAQARAAERKGTPLDIEASIKRSIKREGKQVALNRINAALEARANHAAA